MRNLKKYIKLYKENITIILVLCFLNTFAFLTYQEKNNLLSLIYMLFAITITIKIVFNKINA